MFTYLVIDEADNKSAPFIMSMEQIAEYVVATFPVGAAVPLRVYRLLPKQEPQRMYLDRCNVHTPAGFIPRAIEIRDRYHNIQDMFTFKTA